MQYNEFAEIMIFGITRVLQKIRNTSSSDTTVGDNVVEVVLKQALSKDREIGGQALVRLYSPSPHDRCVIRRMLLRMPDKITKSQQALSLKLRTRKTSVATQARHSIQVRSIFGHLFQKRTASFHMLDYQQ